MTISYTNGLNPETALAGSILVDARCMDNLPEHISVTDFTSGNCAAVFQAAQLLQSAGEPIDPMTIQKTAAERGEQLSVEYLMELMEITPTAKNAGAYAKQIVENSKRRRLREFAEAILEDNSTPVSNMLTDASLKIQAMLEEEVEGKCLSSEEVLLSFYDMLRERALGKRNVIPSGYKKLDELLGGGFLRSGLYILAARPGMGKSTFALNILDQVEGPALFVSLEMSPDQLTAKRIARKTEIPAQKLLMSGNLSDIEYEKIALATTELSTKPVSINRKMGASVAEVATMARTIKGLKLIIIDYLGLLRSETKGSRYEQVTEISGALKRLAINLNVPIIALAQLNRQTEGRGNNKPQLSDLRDSGALEQDADAVLLLYRNDYYLESGERCECSLVEVNIAKNRHGECGRVHFDAYLALSLFLEGIA